MRRVVLIIIVLAMAFGWIYTEMAFSGEKEDLQFRLQILHERLGRLQAEFINSSREKQDVENRLAELMKQEQKKVEPEKK